MTDQPRPALHLTNWSSRRLHGPGRKWTIMRNPRQWERGAGRVLALTPPANDLADVRSGAMAPETYAAKCEARFRAQDLRPGQIWAEDASTAAELVADGDTLCCACSREAAARGECHRVVAARLLVEAGWRVVLDGEEVSCG